MSIITRMSFLLFIASMMNSVSVAESRGFSYFGLGYDFLDYEEITTRNIDGKVVDVETVTSVNLAQRSGGFVAINPTWGFQLSSASTLGSSVSNEEWVIDDSIVLNNKVSFNRQSLHILGFHKVLHKHAIILGLQYSSFKFERFAATLTPASDDFNIETLTISQGAVSENVWQLYSLIGYEYNEFFISSSPAWRFRFQSVVGIPLISEIRNTDVENGRAFRENFDGYLLSFNASAGYQINHNFIIAGSVEVGYKRQNAFKGGIKYNSAGALTELPENVSIYYYPSIELYWSF